MAKYSVVVASDNRLFRAALIPGLENDAFTVAATVDVTLELTTTLMALDHQPDAVIVDSPTDLDREITILKDIKRTLPDIEILVLADQVDNGHIARVLHTGARIFLPKSISLTTLRLVLELAALGENLFTAPLQFANHGRTAQRAAATKNTAQSPVALSEREFQILDYLGAGFPNKAIAAELGVAEATVKVHIKSVMRKINVKNRTQAAVWLMNNRQRKKADSETPPGPAKTRD